MATTINLESRLLRPARGHAVYLRASWEEDWAHVPYLFADEVAWRLAPSLSTATLTWRYGRGMRQGEFSLRNIARLADVRRLFVKILIAGHAATTAEITAERGGTLPTPFAWYGSIELDGYANEGLIPTGVSEGEIVYLQTGTQPLVAIGLEQALYKHPIRGYTFLDAAGTEKRGERPPIFNRRNSAGEPTGNRSADRGLASYLFAPDIGENDATLWRSRTILEYLVANERPRSGMGAAFPYFIGADYHGFLPDWDIPVIDTEGLSHGDALNVLMPRSRMLSWKLDVQESEGLDEVHLIPVSLFGSDVSTDLGVLKANDRQIALQGSTRADLSPDTTYTVRESELFRIDQARVRGARRTSTCTLRRSSSVTPNRSIGPGWPTALQTEYNAGFSGADTYAGLGTDGKQAANAEVRHTDRLFPVFRRFAIPAAWDQTVNQADDDEQKYAVFLKNDGNPLEKRMVCPRDIELAPTLPFREGFNYQSLGSLSLRMPPEKVSDGPHFRLAAFVLFKTPDWDGAGDAPYIQVEKIGVGNAVEQVTHNRDRQWSARVEVPRQDRALLIHVHGEPQHVLAYNDFTRLNVDERLAHWDWRDGLYTVCLLDDRHCEGIYPPDDEVDFNVAGYRRELVIDAGDEYKQDYVVPGTVVGIDVATRQPVRCPTGGWVTDDRKILAARARQVYEYYGQTRRTLSLATPLLTSQLQTGQYVTEFGSEASVKSLGTVISEIVVTIPSNTSSSTGGGSVGPPMLQLTTAFAELETIELTNRPPEDKQLSGRKTALAGARA